MQSERSRICWGEIVLLNTRGNCPTGGNVQRELSCTLLGRYSLAWLGYPLNSTLPIHLSFPSHSSPHPFSSTFPIPPIYGLTFSSYPYIPSSPPLLSLHSCHPFYFPSAFPPFYFLSPSPPSHSNRPRTRPSFPSFFNCPSPAIYPINQSGPQRVRLVAKTTFRATNSARHGYEFGACSFCCFTFTELHKESCSIVVLMLSRRIRL